MMIADRLSPNRLLKRGETLVGQFSAMGCSCEVLIDTEDIGLGRELVAIASTEAWRIEKKFSRYNTEGAVHAINAADGKPVSVDPETAHLLDFADRCFDVSGGRFDITSGVLRRAWKFDGSDRLPSPYAVRRLLPLVGWKKVGWRRPEIQLAPGMEIDLGGIGKEYAVDRALRLLQARTGAAVLVNFGGDIAAGGRRRRGDAWSVGIEDANRPDQPARVLQLSRGALATSGDAKKFLQANGRRYGHILDPRTGWPVPDAPRSVTVAAETCTEAGFLSTLAVLSGKAAGALLAETGVPYWISM